MHESASMASLPELLKSKQGSVNVQHGISKETPPLDFLQRHEISMTTAVMSSDCFYLRKGNE